MGVDTNLHIGPYLRIPQKTKKIPTQVQICSGNNKHEVKTVYVTKPVQRFCQDCGSPIIWTEVFMDKKINPREYFVSEDDLSYTDGMTGESDIWIANKYSPWDRMRNVEKIITDTQIDPQKEIEWFEETYTENISKLQEVFGPLKVEWGIFNWYS